MLGLLALFFILPLMLLFICFSMLGILIIPIMFLVVSILAVMIFSGLFYWIFLGFLVASAIYLALYTGDRLFKRLENKKVFKFIIIFIVLVIMLIFIRERYTHTTIEIINQSTGTTFESKENIINF